jgi:hypothetical protein
MTTKTTKDTAKDAAKDVAEAVKTTVAAKAESAKQSAADMAEAEARGWNEAASAFRADSFSRQAAEHLADQLSSAASAVRDTDLSTLQADLTAFARRNPLLFFGGAAILGFAAIRALKASERAETADHGDYPAIPDGQRAYPETNPRLQGHV